MGKELACFIILLFNGGHSRRWGGEARDRGKNLFICWSLVSFIFERMRCGVCGYLVESGVCGYCIECRCLGSYGQ